MKPLPVQERRTRCVHCGGPNPPGREDTGTCCEGCAYVHRLIEAEGLGHYYDLRGDTIPPPRPVSTAWRDFTWLSARQSAAEASLSPPHLTLEIQGVSCIGCVWLLERLFLRQPGAVRCEVNVPLGQARFVWRPGQIDLVAYARELEKYGYLLGPQGERVPQESRALLGRLGACAAFALNGMLFTLPSYLGMADDFALAPLFSLLTLLFATLSFAVGGSYFITRALTGLRSGVLHLDLPIALGVSLAYLGSLIGWLLADDRLLYFDFVCTFMFLMLGGRWLQERSIERNRNLLLARNPAPMEVEVAGPSGYARRPVDALHPSDTFRVQPGHIFPVAARLHAAADLALDWINGEPEPRAFAAGQTVPAGARNLLRTPVEAEALEGWDRSLLARLLRLTPRHFRHERAERIIRAYIVVVLLLAALAAAFHLWLGDGRQAFQSALSVLIVSCPCAIGVALPMVTEMAILRLRGLGVFVQQASLFERLLTARTLVFDKTGTLTLEEPRLTNPDALATLSPPGRTALWHLVADSLHPVSRSLAAHLRQHPAPRPHTPISEVPGQGAHFLSGDDHWALGRAPWATQITGGTQPPPDPSLTALAHNGTLVASFAFTDALRVDAAAVMRRLRHHFDVAILSGDRPENVARIAHQLHLSPHAARGDLSPDAKATWVRQRPGGTIFIGDGANDSLAFDAASVRGTPVIDRGLLEHKSDFYFLGHRLSGVADLVDTTHHRHRRLRLIFALTVAYNLGVVYLAIVGSMSPLLAAVAMPASAFVTVSVAMLRLR